ncbi:hypothetical protein SAMN04487765_1835 [Tenacibaculum sp. MAR_2010_89]|uniref:HEAT repeat domain-containing protein n=1 Tax=Tenacibaculum sp. MAR_2010_89 TaxID=1250198 RepID=UPI000896C386|nr:HEAT repeat domain-containing protein [Tenacibaculum sp. MAR_2010_89]SEE23037.1 hypothetical protein SAMN04487765_1835 [Tenacibaculum sp. MAR_2010_89]
MKQNLNSKNSQIFKKFEDKILLLNNENDILNEVNIFSKSISINGILNHLLELFSNEKYYLPNNSTQNKITLFSSSSYEFSLIHTPPEVRTSSEATSLYTYTNNVFFCPLIDVNDVRYTIYEQNKRVAPDVLDEDVKLQIKKENVFVKNETIFLRKFKDVLRFDGTKPLLLFMIISRKDTLKYSWEYNSISLKPVRIVLREVNFARLGTTAKILGNIGDGNSKALLLKLSQHESHIVRWEAARALINIDFEEGVSVLKRMMNDKHIEISMAAKQSVQMLNV